MRVIGAGMGRTGTLSLKAALERLGCGPCYHMLEVMEHPEHVPLWSARARGETVPWERMLGGYQATVDWPACSFWRELTAAYPGAGVLLSVRDPQRWYESMLTTVYRVSTTPVEAMPPHLAPFREMVRALVWEGTFGGRFEDRAHAIAAFERHNEEVRRGVPAERLLVYEVGQGWGPLCAFLGVPEPDEPFPHLNDSASFHARIEEGAFSRPPSAPPARP